MYRAQSEAKIITSRKDKRQLTAPLEKQLSFQKLYEQETDFSRNSFIITNRFS